MTPDGILVIGRTLSHYRVTGVLGSGGMGVVYRARDLHLGRDVALKVLPPAALSDPSARRRFRKTAHFLSRLNDPHIAMVYDFDSQDDVDFLVMELVEGPLLKERITKGPLPEAELRLMGAQIAAALQSAHDKGVIHRDLKPGNIVLAHGDRVKVLDFGLAKLLSSDITDRTESMLTETGVTVGTLPYMSPEQLLNQEIDTRSDLFALGVVLYEMAAGRLPWTESVPTALVHEIVTRPPRSLRELRPGISPECQTLIERCLRKNPNERISSAREIRQALEGLDRRDQARLARRVGSRLPFPRRVPRKRWVLGTAALILVSAAALVTDRLLPAGCHGKDPEIRALAVLPFQNVSSDSSYDYFAEGMTDEITTRLAQIRDLRVRPRASVRAYSTRNAPDRIRELGRELEIDGLLTGSVLRAGNRVRISAQLVRVRDEWNLWADSYEGTLQDVLALQGQIARSVADRVRVHVTSSEHGRLARTRQVHPEAHDDYLRGKRSLDLMTEDGLRTAIRQFHHAIELDATFAQAYVGLADAYLKISSIYMPATEAMPKAKAAALHAVELDPGQGEAYGMLASVKAFYDWQWQDAERDFRRSLDLAPNSDQVWEYYGALLFVNRRFEEAEAARNRAREINPLSSRFVSSGNASALNLQRRHGEAITVLTKLLAEHPDDYIGHLILGQCYLWTNREDQGLEEVRMAHRLEESPGTLAWVGVAEARCGQMDAARSVLDRLRERSRTEYVQPYLFGIVHAAMGDRDLAFRALSQAVAERSEELINLQLDPALDPLRADPRFATLVRQLGFESGERRGSAGPS